MINGTLSNTHTSCAVWFNPEGKQMANTTLYDRVQASPADTVAALPTAQLQTPVEGGYLYRDQQGKAYFLFSADRETVYRVHDMDAAWDIIRGGSLDFELPEKDAPFYMRRLENMREVAVPWVQKHGKRGLDIMLDVESFGDCLPSLAIVPFDRLTGETMPADGCLFLTLDTDWQIKAGLLPDHQTMKWWLTRTSDAARKALYDLPGSFQCSTPEQLGIMFHIMQAAWQITGKHEHHRVWGKPASYDWPKVERLCKVAGVPMPFHFRTSRCCRTIASELGQPTKQERDEWKTANNIVSHDPYDDCRLQAWEVAVVSRQGFLRKTQALMTNSKHPTAKFIPGRRYRCLDPRYQDQEATLIGPHPDDGASCVAEVGDNLDLVILEWSELGEEIR